MLHSNALKAEFAGRASLCNYNSWARCFANLSEFDKILGSIFLKVWKYIKVSKECFRINFSSTFCSMECWQVQFNRVEEVCKLNISFKYMFFPEIKFNWLMRKKMKANLNESSTFQFNRTEKTTEKRLLTSSNRATIVCTYKEQHKLAAQKTFFL